MDYKELILRLRCSTCEDNKLDAAAAIETLLTEIEAAMKDLRQYGSCMICAHSCTYHNGEPCKLREECYMNDCWQWHNTSHPLVFDVASVVRCKDCKFRDGSPGQPNILCGQMKDDDFCSYGELR